MTRLTDDTLITTALLQRFVLEAEQEGGTPAYYALIRRSNGQLHTHHPFGVHCEVAQLLWASDILELLNTELHHDGAWVLCFTHPVASKAGPRSRADYQRYCLIWLDEDGDPQFTVEWTAKETTELFEFADVVAAGIFATAQLCQAAWQTWHLHMKDVLDPQEGQTFKRAKGQRAPSARA